MALFSSDNVESLMEQVTVPPTDFYFLHVRSEENGDETFDAYYSDDTEFENVVFRITLEQKYFI